MRKNTIFILGVFIIGLEINTESTLNGHIAFGLSALGCKKRLS